MLLELISKWITVSLLSSIKLSFKLSLGVFQAYSEALSTAVILYEGILSSQAFYILLFLRKMSQTDARTYAWTRS